MLVKYWCCVMHSVKLHYYLYIIKFQKGTQQYGHVQWFLQVFHRRGYEIIAEAKTSVWGAVGDADDKHK